MPTDKGSSSNLGQNGAKESFGSKLGQLLVHSGEFSDRVMLGQRIIESDLISSMRTKSEAIFSIKRVNILEILILLTYMCFPTLALLLDHAKICFKKMPAMLAGFVVNVKL